MQDTSEESQGARDSEKPKISIFIKMDLGPFRIGGDLDLGPFRIGGYLDLGPFKNKVANSFLLPKT